MGSIPDWVIPKTLKIVPIASQKIHILIETKAHAWILKWVQLKSYRESSGAGHKITMNIHTLRLGTHLLVTSFGKILLKLSEGTSKLRPSGIMANLIKLLRGRF